MLLNLWNRRDINQGVQQWKSTKGAVLLDVRTKEEYREFHIPGSLNLPLDRLHTISGSIPEQTTPIFVCCLSGGRSARAAAYLKQSGYSQVQDIGGISAYGGETESGGGVVGC